MTTTDYVYMRPHARRGISVRTARKMAAAVGGIAVVLTGFAVAAEHVETNALLGLAAMARPPAVSVAAPRAHPAP